MSITIVSTTASAPDRQLGVWHIHKVWSHLHRQCCWTTATWGYGCEFESAGTHLRGVCMEWKNVKLQNFTIKLLQSSVLLTNCIKINLKGFTVLYPLFVPHFLSFTFVLSSPLKCDLSKIIIITNNNNNNYYYYYYY